MARTMNHFDLLSALSGVCGAMLAANAAKLYVDWFGASNAPDWQGEAASVMLVGASLSFIVMGFLVGLARKERQTRAEVA